MKRFCLISVLVAFCWQVGCTVMKKYYPDDNPIEEAVEDVIREETGINADLSGRSPE